MAQTKVVPPVLRRRGGEPPDFWGRGREEESLPPLVSAPRLGIWLLLAALTMMFGAFTSAYLVRLPGKSQFPFDPPAILGFNTFVLLLSSGTYQWALRAIRHNNQKGLVFGLWMTLMLGSLFLVGQLYGWHQLVQAGVYAQTNVFSGFFYVLTATHGVHLLVGIGLLFYIWMQAVRRRYHAEHPLPVELGALYWHYLDFVWLWLFILLRFIG